MGRLHHSHERLHLQHRDAYPNANAEPSQLAQLLDATLVRLSGLSKRAATGSDDDTCTPDDKDDHCAKPAASSNVTLPVLLGVL